MIEIRNLHKTFPGNPAATLQALSLRIESGEFFSLFGPSGCGKSTLLRCIAGLEIPDSGEIRIDDAIVFSSESRILVPANKRRIGMVFQSYAIWPHMTVLENVAFPLEAQRIADAGARAMAALESVGLADLSARHASRLSGGQQQRVALARAIVARPSVLLLDEPLSNLDAALRDQMRAEIMRLQKNVGVTAVYVTHDQREALSMSDRIAVMQAGHFVEIATPPALFYRPQAAFSAKLIGGANIISGVALRTIDGRTLLETGLGTLISSQSIQGPVEIFIRPEKIAMLAVGEPDRVNTIACTVRERRFIGDSTEFDLACGAGEATLLRCRIAADPMTRAGESVRVVMEPGDLISFQRSIPA